MMDGGRGGRRTAPRPLTFKRVALSLIACAVLLACLNLYMNLVSAYSLPSLQLDLSPNGDILGFHQFDLQSSSVQQHSRMAVHPKQVHRSAQTVSSCPGLCVSSHSSQTQLNFVKAMVQAHMRHLPANTFRVHNVSFVSLARTQSTDGNVDYSAVWRTVASWTGPRRLVPTGLDDKTFAQVVTAVSTAKILRTGIPTRGTQLKLTVQLQSGQEGLLKPGRYGTQTDIPTDTAYAGADRHNGEIAAWHLALLLDLNRVPVVVGRRLHMRTELLDTADQSLQRTFFRRVLSSGHDQLCLFGKCLYCHKGDPVCETVNGTLDSAIILWLPKGYDKLEAIRSPWARTYDASRLAPWQTSQQHCSKVMEHEFFGKVPVFLDLMDMAVFDFIIGNADRHRLERISGVEPAMILLLDNGKSFGGSNSDDLSILAPLYQCCRIRKKLYSTLLRYSEIDFASLLNQRLRMDPLFPILNEQQLEAVNRRIRVVLVVVAACIQSHGIDSVLQNDGF